MSEGLSISKRDAILNLAVTVGVLVGLYFLIKYVGLDDIRGYVEAAGLWAPVILVLAKASTIVIAPLGGGPLYPLAGAIFGFWEAFFLLMLGDILGGVIAFFIGRRFGQRILHYFFPSQEHAAHRLLSLFDTLRGLFIARLTLIALPELFTYAAGVSRARFVPFVLVYTSVNAIPTAFMISLGVFLAQSYGPFIVPLILGVTTMITFVMFSYVYADNLGLRDAE